jgi:hypothetical protein
MWDKGSKDNGKFVCCFDRCAYHESAVKRNRCLQYDRSKGGSCFTNKHRRPLKSAVAARSASTNISYTSALRKRVKDYFPVYSVSVVNAFIKSVQRLNASKAKHCA